ncbi:MAG: chitobiase/beta-hexosaminidase C-terminal domain-containing protein [Phycisphaerae bacterium]|nr:chitobiase/beta-hexosaminidase C-terminal domain-containing protein [Phycisphaerae bacterium]
MRNLMLIFITCICVCGCGVHSEWKPVEGRITTKWAEDVNPDKPWNEYPRPMMVRKGWVNLNGLWDYAIVPKDSKKPSEWDGKILVPYAIESALSGVGKKVGIDNSLWYRTTFTYGKNDSKRKLLHFGAVDWESTVWVNGKEIGTHKGGHDPFSYDISDALIYPGKQEIIIRVWDPTNANNSPQPRGKQTISPSGCFYTSVTGIWQTVWLETVPEDASITKLKMTPDIDSSTITIELSYEAKVGIDMPGIKVEVLDNGKVIANDRFAWSKPITIKIDNPKLWSPDSPHLYDVNIQLGNDKVSSYFGMRKSSIGKDENGMNRLLLNNKPLFQLGPLDQGWWPDGLYTPATDEALRYDVEMTKALGFNMLRKHVKSEPQRFYYWCDKLGIVVWQDMPGALYEDSEYSEEQLRAIYDQWDVEWKAVIDALYNHPSIVMWVPFNEGWGQRETEKVTAWTKNYDPSRLVDNASGWTDKGVGDVHDVHSYPGPAMPELEDNRAAVLGEFGGLGLPFAGHLWNESGRNWGYRNFEDQKAYQDKYVDLIQKLYLLVDKGLAAAVYTQTSDVEGEINGLMTYDRKVVKLDPKKFALINKRILPPIFENQFALFYDKAAVKLAGEKTAEIRYTVDGSDPKKSSELYTGPFDITEETTVKARCYWPDGKESPISQKTFKTGTPLKSVSQAANNAGLKFEYYEGQFRKLPDFSNTKTVKSGIAKSLSISVVDDKEDYALRFTGFIDAPKTGSYVFSINSDDGTKMFIHGKEIISNDGVHGMEEKSGALVLEAGPHPVEIQYFQGAGGQGLEVYWQSEMNDKQIIPVEVLKH